MLYIISFLGVFIENSLPFSANIYIVTLSFFIYLISLKQKRNVILVVLISLLLALQTNHFFRFLVILVCSYYIISYLFSNLSYSKVNILIISLIQLCIYSLLAINNLQINYLIINFIGFIVLNYIYIKIAQKNQNIRG